MKTTTGALIFLCIIGLFGASVWFLGQEEIEKESVDSDFYEISDDSKEEVGKFDFFQSGNLMINNPGMKEGEWHLSYEEKGSPALKKMIDFNEEHVDCYAEEDVCSKFFSKDDSLQGARVEISGEEKEDEVNLLKIKFLEY